MTTKRVNPSIRITEATKPSVLNKLSLMYQEAIRLIKYTYLVLVLVMICITIIELKHTYQIDIFPGIDTPFDNVYYAQKDQMNVNWN
jgi:hypothetical protein